MSRIGKRPVTVPAGVTVASSDGKLTVKGPKGALEMPVRPEVKVSVDDGGKTVNVSIDEKDGDVRLVKSLWGTTRANIQNMIVGVTQGYSKSLEIIGVGWGAQLMGDKLKLSLGFANPIFVAVPKGITVVVDKAVGNKVPVTVSGVDKQAVGQFAATVRAKRKPEPYNGKGVRYLGEAVRQKQGKAVG